MMNTFMRFPVKSGLPATILLKYALYYIHNNSHYPKGNL